MQIILFQLLLLIISIFIVKIFYNKCKTQQLRLIQKILKIVVSLGLVFFTLHVGLLLININEKYTLHLFGFCGTGAILLVASALILELCWVFVGSSIYCYLVHECIILQIDGFFDGYLLESRITVFVIGLFLIINLIRKIVV